MRLFLQQKEAKALSFLDLRRPRGGHIDPWAGAVAGLILGSVPSAGGALLETWRPRDHSQAAAVVGLGVEIITAPALLLGGY